MKNACKIFTTRHSTCPKNSTCPFYLSLFVCLKAKKINYRACEFLREGKNLLIEPASPIFSGARATSREMSRDESAIFPDGAEELLVSTCNQYVIDLLDSEKLTESE